jgi:hypothetical protein
MGEGLNRVVVLLALFAYVDVRTDGKAVQRSVAFLGPFGERLRHQGKAGHQKQHALACTGQTLGNLQADEGIGLRKERLSGVDADPFCV